MIDQMTITHHIQKDIIDVLLYKEIARFRDLRPKKVDTNLFSYHLQSVIKAGIVEKVEGGYTLTTKGLSYVDRLSTQNKTIRMQPKIITMLLIQNSDGDVLLQRRTKQPYINAWTLPYGKVHIDDMSIEAAAQREALEKLGLADQPLKHSGIAYIRVLDKDQVLSTTTAHVCTFNRDDIALNDDLRWARPHKLRALHLAPAVEEIIARGFFRDPFFFEEYTVQWPTSLSSQVGA